MNRRANILYLLSTATPGSGGAAHVAALTRGIQPGTLSWEIVTPAGGEIFPGRNTPPGFPGRLPFRDNGDLYTLLRLYCLIRRRRYDLVHTHLNRAGWLGGLAAVLAGVPAVHTVHGLDRPMYCRWARRVIAVSRSGRDHLARTGVPKEKLRLVYNGIWTGDFDDKPRGRKTRSEHACTACLVGRLHAAKGQNTAIRAVAWLNRAGYNVRLVLAGEGPERSNLEALAHSLAGRGTVEFTGDITNIAGLLHETDVFLLPSRRESCPLALLEAMAAGTPAVVSDAGGTPELVTHGKEALIIPADDPGRLAAAMAMLIDNPPLRQRLAAAAKERVNEQFHATRMVRETLEVYRELM